jgi:predicted acylesterase/phospholipase RssA
MSFRRVVMSGGGAHCLAFVGCLRYLERHGADGLRDLDTLVGCSAGALCCLLCVLGYSSSEIVTLMTERFCTMGCHVIDVEGVFDVADSWGIDDGHNFTRFVRSVLRERTGFDDITFADLKRAYGKDLVVVATNVTQARREFFDASRTPTTSVVTALRMSMAVPVVYTPVRYGGDVYVDGGVLDNVPVDYFDAGGAGGAGKVLVLRVRRAPRDAGPASFMDYVACVLSVLVEGGPDEAPDASIDTNRTTIDICVPHSPSSGMFGLKADALQFDMERRAIDDLLELGYQAAARALAAE